MLVNMACTILTIVSHIVSGFKCYKICKQKFSFSFLSRRRISDDDDDGHDGGADADDGGGDDSDDDNDDNDDYSIISDNSHNVFQK